MDSDDLKSAAAKSMEGSGDIRERVRELTLAAIRQRKFDFAGMKDVMHQVSDGITLGAERRGEDLKQALGDAYRGMDEAFSKSAQATQLALSELVSKGREFNDSEVRATLEAMRKLEKDLLATLAGSAEKTGGRIKEEMQELARIAREAKKPKVSRRNQRVHRQFLAGLWRAQRLLANVPTDPMMPTGGMRSASIGVASLALGATIASIAQLSAAVSIPLTVVLFIVTVMHVSFQEQEVPSPTWT